MLRRLRQVTLILAGWAMLSTASADPPAAGSGFQWLPVSELTDHFQTHPALGKWRVPDTSACTCGDCQQYDPANLSLAAGGVTSPLGLPVDAKLRINAYVVNDALCGGQPRIRSAAIRSVALGFYGYYEVLAKASPTALDSAFWLFRNILTGTTPTASADLEIDIFEIGALATAPYLSAPAPWTTHTNVWARNATEGPENSIRYTDAPSACEDFPQAIDLRTVAPPILSAPETLSSGFHKFGLLWDYDGLFFYVDDRLVRTLSFPWCASNGLSRMRAPMRVLLSLGKADEWFGSALEQLCPGCDVAMEVGWVKAWRKAHTSGRHRAYVSAYRGEDDNFRLGCTLNAPCRYFQTALAAVNPGGEVIALDGGGYGAVWITNSVSLIAPPGVDASITAYPGFDGVTITNAGVKVVLRGLAINSAGGRHGIRVESSSQLLVEDCRISGFREAAKFSTGISVAATATVNLVNTTVRDAFIGASFAEGAQASIVDSRILGSRATGIKVVGDKTATTTRALIIGSTVANAPEALGSCVPDPNDPDSCLTSKGIDIYALQGSAWAGVFGSRVQGSCLAIKVSGQNSATSTLMLSANRLGVSAPAAVCTTPFGISLYGSQTVLSTGDNAVNNGSNAKNGSASNSVLTPAPRI